MECGAGVYHFLLFFQGPFVVVFLLVDVTHFWEREIKHNGIYRRIMDMGYWARGEVI